MAEASFADRYAEAGISPTAEIIQKRQTGVDRIVDSVTKVQVIDLVAFYYGLQTPDPVWLRDELLKDDPTFSLISNKREAQLLSAIMLGKLIFKGDDLAALSVVVGQASGRRSPQEAQWLIHEANDALARFAVSQRTPRNVESKVAYTTVKSLEKEIAAVGPNDWAALLAMIGKVRSESQSSMATMSKQATAIAEELERRTGFQREESQMLWWVYNGLSRSLDRTFATLDSLQAAIVAAVDLARLTTRSRVAPVAAPVLLERVIAGSKKMKARSATLSGAVDGLQADDLAKLEIDSTKVLPPMTPITTALGLAATMGMGAWHSKFSDMVGFSATTEFEPLELSRQLYHEHLLGQLL